MLPSLFSQALQKWVFLVFSFPPLPYPAQQSTVCIHGCKLLHPWMHKSASMFAKYVCFAAFDFPLWETQQHDE